MPSRPRLAGVLLLALAGSAVPAGLSQAGASEPPLPPVTVSQDIVAAAQAQVQSMNGLVTSVAARLGEGTARWTAGRAELERTQALAADAAARAELARAVAAGTRRTLGVFVAAAYRSPVTAPLILTLGAGPPGVADALRSQTDLDHIQLSQTVALRDAVAADGQASLADEQASAERASALAQERALAADLAGLQSLAQRTSGQLQAATTELDRLETQRATELAALEAARAAAAERAQAARQADLARRARQAAAPPPAAPFRPGPRTTPPTGACAGRSLSGYSNGGIPASALCPLVYAPGHRLRADAAAAFNRLTEAAKASTGSPLCVTDSYRDYATQVLLFATKPGLAAIPGTSNHGWGVAVDLCGGVQDFGSPMHQWMKAQAGLYGWVHPSWAEPGGGRPEPWHWEFAG